MLITEQVATAPCTDPIQVRFLLLRQSTFSHSPFIPQVPSSMKAQACMI
jgi:hypothetical protein